MSENKKTDYKAIYENRALFGSQTIYAAEDHFLMAKNRAYTEEYSRFFYKDIIALKILVDKWANGMLIMLVILSLLFLLIASLMDDIVGNAIFGTICGVFVLASVWVFIFGPQVKLTIKTVATEQKFPMGRRGKVLKLLKKMRPYIEGAQGSFDMAALKQEIEDSEQNYKV